MQATAPLDTHQHMPAARALPPRVLPAPSYPRRPACAMPELRRPPPRPSPHTAVKKSKMALPIVRHSMANVGHFVLSAAL